MSLPEHRDIIDERQVTVGAVIQLRIATNGPERIIPTNKRVQIAEKMLEQPSSTSCPPSIVDPHFIETFEGAGPPKMLESSTPTSRRPDGRPRFTRANPFPLEPTKGVKIAPSNFALKVSQHPVGHDLLLPLSQDHGGRLPLESAQW